MMKNFIFVVILFILFFAPLSQAAAQNSPLNTQDTSESLAFFDTTGFPQWALDLRRFDIIAFGTFPFSMFFVNFFYDMYRWIYFTGMDFSAQGRMYAPWPFRSAGGYDKSSVELRNTIIVAVGISVIIAVVDLIIYKERQRREQDRIQNIPPSGAFDIITNNGEDADESPPDYPPDLGETSEITGSLE